MEMWAIVSEGIVIFSDLSKISSLPLGEEKKDIIFWTKDEKHFSLDEKHWNAKFSLPVEKLVVDMGDRSHKFPVLTSKLDSETLLFKTFTLLVRKVMRKRLTSKQKKKYLEFRKYKWKSDGTNQNYANLWGDEEPLLDLSYSSKVLTRYWVR